MVRIERVEDREIFNEVWGAAHVTVFRSSPKRDKFSRP